MADKDTLMEELVATEAAKNEDAAKDLERVEQEIVAEATMSTEYDDALGNEQLPPRMRRLPSSLSRPRLRPSNRSKTRMRAVRLANLRPVR